MSDNNVLIEVKDLHKSFKDHDVLKGIDITIKKGEVIAIIGPSGCGKSTFLRSMNLLETPTSGQITFEGNDITSEDTDIDLMRQRIGMVFQQFNLFPNMTIKKNIMLAPVQLGKMSEEEASNKADELLDRIGLSDKAESYPAQLSGGQKQRVAIARALVNSPDVLLADEPTGALDQKSGRDVMDLFQKLNEEGVTIVMITHDAGIANHAKRVMHIIDGVIGEGKYVLDENGEPVILDANGSKEVAHV